MPCSDKCGRHRPQATAYLLTGLSGLMISAVRSLICSIESTPLDPKRGISEQTIYTWRKRFGALQSDDVRRLKQLEDENARLKKIVADLTLDREMLQDVIRRKL